MSTRTRIDLSAGWQFLRRRPRRRWLAFGASPEPAGEAVDLPHCWNRLDTFQPGVPYYRGPGSYRRTFTAGDEPAPRAAWLCCDGFYGTGDLWLDGRRLARFDGQYLGFRIPVTGLLRPGVAHRLGIRLTNRCGRWTLPGIADPDFVLHGGLAGRIWLELAPPVHLDDEATLARPLDAGRDTARVEVRATVVNEGSAPTRVDIVWTLARPDGSLLAETRAPTLEIQAGERREVAAILPARGAAPWSPGHPALHRITCELREADRTLDRTDRRVGFRTAEFRPDAGFFLNGERVFLRGCNRHENLPGMGNALPDAAHRADARAIRDAGLNFVRLSHYPQSPAFLDACDELGILVYAELASWKSVRNGPWLRRAIRQFDAMIRRDRHHPSVILWGMGNESRSRNAYTALRGVALRLDPTRAVTYAENHLYRARRARTPGIPDVWGCNYELDALEEGRDAARLRTVVVSECCNAPHARRGDLAAEREQLAQLEADLPRIEALPYVAGFALWCFADYATLRKRRFLRHCGIVDAWREPKLAVAWLKARHGTLPFVALAADWSEDVAGHGVTRRVDVFSSVERVAVRVNGRLAQSVAGRGHHVLELAFEPGTLEAVAEADDAAHDTIESFGPAARLSLEADPTDAGALRLRVVDAQGRWVRDWHGDAEIATGGTALAFPYRPGRIRVDGGSARIFVGRAAGDAPAEWHLSTPGLSAAVLRR